MAPSPFHRKNLRTVSRIELIVSGAGVMNVHVKELTQMQQTQTITSAQVKAGLMILKAVADTIRELGEVPAGTLYAMMMDRMDLAAFNKMIDTLLLSGLVEKRASHLLVWVG